ncbi:MAG: DUF1569 domain-containing protein [Planctomycetes bacterium]|nr:DUF1569 domain-containing protein [Planctomycetota bacterium]
MKSLFDSDHCQRIVGRIESIDPDTKPLWGKMNLAQTLAHLRKPIEVALGERVLPRSFLGRMLGGLVKKGAVGPKPFKQGLPTDPRLLESDPKGVGAEKSALLEKLRSLCEGGPAALTKDPHPFFGRLTTAEWDSLMSKHLDHHLRQFGA